MLAVHWQVVRIEEKDYHSIEAAYIMNPRKLFQSETPLENFNEWNMK